jgi:hypothetical protein
MKNMLDKTSLMRYHFGIRLIIQETYMKTLYCDICGNALEEPIPNRNYFVIREYDVCEPCKDVIDSRLRPVLRNHFPYSPEWFEQQIISFIERGVSTGRP